MKTSDDFIEFIIDTFADLGEIKCTRLFGGYGFYYKDKIVGLINNNQLFIKKTVAGKRNFPDLTEAKPRPRHNPQFLIEDFDEREHLYQLIKITYTELPSSNKN